jgi:molybdopterin converting factor small subunit
MIVALTFHIPGALREFTAGRTTVSVNFTAGTLSEALSVLCNLYPGVRDRVLTEQGQIRQHINIFVDTENVRYTGGLTTHIHEDSEVHIVPAVSGG